MLWLEMTVQTDMQGVCRARGEVKMMISISFYFYNRRRVFAHPCY